MPARPIARICPLLLAALMAAACGAQVMGAPGTLPNGRRIPLPPGQQLPPDTTPQQQAPQQNQLASANPGASSSPSAAPAALTAPSLLDKPAQPATVTLSGRSLSVSADNSSLTDILHQLSVSSGMTIDGLDKDSRVFGTYGPGNPRDILGELLDGAGYNVMMVGYTTAGTPRQLVLTARSNAPAAQAQPNRFAEREEDQDDNEPLNNNPPPEEIQPRQPTDDAQPAPQNPPGNPRTPQQLLQEMQQMRQQQQQQQQQNPQ
jgi:hypothetical protein